MSRLVRSPFLIALLAAACVSPPQVEHPQLDIATPSRWTGAETVQGHIGDEWWRGFGDAELEKVIVLALGQNYDLQAAAARVEQAVAQATIAGADLQPKLGASSSGQRRRQNFIGFPIPGGGDEVLSTTATTYGLSLNLSWEVDLWGKLRATQRAALADMQATEADFHGARLSLLGQTIKVWLAIGEAVQQVALAEQTVSSFRESSDEVWSRYERGLRSSLDVRLSLSNLADAEALLQRRQRELDRVTRQLEILLGRYPGRAVEIPEGLPEMPPAIPAGLPSELVSRRPDLVAAERRLAASNARLDAAEGALYPRFSLTASGGTASEELEDLLDLDYRVWSLVGNLTQPLFEGGRLRAAVDLSRASVEEVLARYVSALLKAYGEVETALSAEHFYAAQVERQGEATHHAIAAQKLAEDRYRAGIENYITVLESQRRAVSNESNLLTARRQQLENRVDLYLALGGGFWGGGFSRTSFVAAPGGSAQEMSASHAEKEAVP
ncbi:MAG: efflux transporter outer membrane subunit [Planctomycetota bacterium]